MYMWIGIAYMYVGEDICTILCVYTHTYSVYVKGVTNTLPSFWIINFVHMQVLPTVQQMSQLGTVYKENSI